MTYDDAEEVDEFEPVDEVENVVEFETVECMNEIRQEELETCEFANDTSEMINNIDFNVNESFSIIENIVNDNISINQIFDDNCADTVKNTKEKTSNKTKFKQQTISKCEKCGRMFVTQGAHA